ncbi:hypothetical protein EDB89DRAFT_1906165 [Lactarius sanguifluus]|nr:hypothetical protein EDB89DRAFT_1906165 [Lactarius sanguifluus]
MNSGMSTGTEWTVVTKSIGNEDPGSEVRELKIIPDPKTVGTEGDNITTSKPFSTGGLTGKAGVLAARALYYNESEAVTVKVMEELCIDSKVMGGSLSGPRPEDILIGQGALILIN